MKIPLLLDQDLEGQGPFLEAGWRETGWEQYLRLELIRLRDLHMPNDATDQEIWPYAQHEHFLLLTNNRNREDATSLQATIDRENTQDSLPVLTVSDTDKLVLPAYRQQAAHKLAAVIIDLENYLGVGRVFIP
jgi:predicted nuclease of predicted toxin-antitoxin system